MNCILNSSGKTRGLFHFASLVFLIAFKFFTVETTTLKQQVTLILVKKCGSMATFQFINSSPLHMPMHNCLLTYKPTSNASPKSKRIKEVTSSNITLTDSSFEPEKVFNVNLKCDEVFSKAENLAAHEVCQPSSTAAWEVSEVVYKEKQTFSSSTTDILLGIMFGVVAIIMVAVTAYYQFRKYQRRRRLQQYLSTPHTDPFERLQDHMEDQVA